MDPPQYSTLLEALKQVPDPRKPRGRQHEWPLLLTILCAALASGHKSVRATAQWAKEHTSELVGQLQPLRHRMPSASTLYRVVRRVDVLALEDQLAHYAQTLEAGCAPASPAAPAAVSASCQHQPHQPHQQHQRHKICAKDKRQSKSQGKSQGKFVGQSIDGKELRGARAHGRVIHLVSLVRHESGVVLGQRAVDCKSNEITAVPFLLQGRDLIGTVTTMDALLTQRAIARQIVDQGGHYLMVVKANQPELYSAIGELFESPSWLASERKASYRKYTKTEKGHGRLETRTLESSWVLGEYARQYLGWAEVQQVMRRTCRRVILKTGEVSEEVTNGISSIGWEEANAQEVEELWRGHWTIENRNHYVRDVTMGEDQNQMRSDNGPQVLAALRNSIVSLIRRSGWSNIADGLRHYGASIHNALQLVTAPVSRSHQGVGVEPGL